MLLNILEIVIDYIFIFSETKYRNVKEKLEKKGTAVVDTNWPDNREEDGSAADEVHQKEDLLPPIVITGSFFCRLDDDVGDISQDLQDDGWRGHQTNSLSVKNNTKLEFLMSTCRGITTMKIFFSLSDRMYFTKAQPVPISASVMNSRAPFSLEAHQYKHQWTHQWTLVYQLNTKQLKHHILGWLHLQVCDIIHDSPGFNRTAFSVDEVIVDLRGQREVS